MQNRIDSSCAGLKQYVDLQKKNGKDIYKIVSRKSTRIDNETKFLISKKGVTLYKGRHQNCAISGTRLSGNKVRVDRILYSSELTPVGRASILNEAILVRRYG